MKKWLAVMSVLTVPLMSPCYGVFPTTEEEAIEADRGGYLSAKPSGYGQIGEKECEEFFAVVRDFRTFRVRKTNADALMSNNSLEAYLKGIRAYDVLAEDPNCTLDERFEVTERLFGLEGRLAQFFARRALQGLNNDSTPFDLRLKVLERLTGLPERESTEDQMKPLAKEVIVRMGVNDVIERAYFLEHCLKYPLIFAEWVQDPRFRALWIEQLNELTQKVDPYGANCPTYYANLLNVGIQLLSTSHDELQQVGRSFLKFLINNVSEAFGAKHLDVELTDCEMLDEENSSLARFYMEHSNTANGQNVLKLLNQKVTLKHRGEDKKIQDLRLKLIQSLKESTNPQDADLRKVLVVKHVNEWTAIYIKEDMRDKFIHDWHNRVSGVLSSLETPLPYSPRYHNEANFTVEEWFESSKNFIIFLQNVRKGVVDRNLCSKFQRELYKCIRSILFKIEFNEKRMDRGSRSDEEVEQRMSDVMTAVNGLRQDIKSNKPLIITQEEIDFINVMATKNIHDWGIVSSPNLLNFLSASSVLNLSSNFYDEIAVLKGVGVDSRVIPAAKEELIRNICKSSNFYATYDILLDESSIKFYSERDNVSPEEGRKRFVAALKMGYDLVMSTYIAIPEPTAESTKFVEDMKAKFKKAGLDFEPKE